MGDGDERHSQSARESSPQPSSMAKRWGMRHTTIIIVIAGCLTAMLGLSGVHAAQRSQPQPQPLSGVVINRGVVELETSGTSGISARMGEDLANIVDDG